MDLSIESFVDNSDPSQPHNNVGKEVELPSITSRWGGCSIITPLPPTAGERRPCHVPPKQGPPGSTAQQRETHPGQEPEKVQAGSPAADTGMTGRKLRPSVWFCASLAGKSTVIRTSSPEGQEGTDRQSGRQPTQRSRGWGLGPVWLGQGHTENRTKGLGG